jgi:uncharacterized membrane protein
MKYKTFLKRIDESAVTEAVARAEKRTSGEICLCISRKRTDDAMATAVELFEKFGMHRTAQRNAVLILLAPESQATAVCGDEGINRICGEGLWDEVIELLRKELAEDPTQAIVDAIQRVGRELAKHFPHVEDDVNELPDKPRYD